MRYRSNLPAAVELPLSAYLVDPAEAARLAAELGPDHKVIVSPGEEFDALGPLNHPLLEALDEEAQGHAQHVAEQDLQHARAYYEQWGASEERGTPPPVDVRLEEREGYVPPPPAPAPATSKKAKE